MKGDLGHYNFECEVFEGGGRRLLNLFHKGATFPIIQKVIFNSEDKPIRSYICEVVREFAKREYNSITDNSHFTFRVSDKGTDKTLASSVVDILIGKSGPVFI